MRFRKIAAAFAVVLGLAIQPSPAEAFDFKRSPVAPEGYHAPRTVNHFIYKPRYDHVYHVSHSADPYAYRYSPRGYYPYHASRHWVPAAHMKHRHRAAPYHGPKYTYHPAWGSKRHGYKHKQYHATRHGYHHRWHW